MKFRRASKATTAMDLGPLVDCVLQLLIFFMLSSTFMSPKVSIALPEGAVGDPLDRNDAILVTATADGQMFMNLEPVALPELEARLADKIRESEAKAVVFRGDRAVDLQTLIKVMLAARRAGARSFDIAHTAPSDSRDE